MVSHFPSSCVKHTNYYSADYSEECKPVSCKGAKLLTVKVYPEECVPVSFMYAELLTVKGYSEDCLNC
jgi:hypothetical protein